MKKLLLLMISICISFCLSSCSSSPSAEVILSDFINTYGAEGEIYSSSAEIGEAGYISEELVKKIYIYEGDFPKNYSIFLNSHSHRGSEAAVFVCEDEEERQAVTEMCLERMRVVSDKADDRVLIRYGNTVAYSTLEDPERAEQLLRKIIRSHS